MRQCPTKAVDLYSSPLPLGHRPVYQRLSQHCILLQSHVLCYMKQQEEKNDLVRRKLLEASK